MRLSRDKLNKLAHVVADTLAETDECEFLDDRNTIRQEARKALEKVLTEEMKIDQAARLKIASQRKIIVEGSQEWDILYRKYYNDEVRKLGLVSRIAARRFTPPCFDILGFLPQSIVASWCNWLTRRPLKAESSGSIPDDATNRILGLNYHAGRPRNRFCVYFAPVSLCRCSSSWAFKG